MTQGIRVRVQSMYLPEQSSPHDDRYVFAYTITISNESTYTAQLRTRHWIITDGRGSVEEVKGDGVVGVIYDLHYSARVTPGTADLCNT